jgi:hypothetical protein
MKLRLTIAAGPGVSTSFEHGGPVIQIGRDPECELSLQGEASTAVSRRHARIELTAAGATLADVGSSNGTLLNGELLKSAAPLRVGDRIQMGYTGATLTVLEIDVGAPPPSEPIRAARPKQAVLIGSLAAVALAAVVGVAAIFLNKPTKDEGAPVPPGSTQLAYFTPNTGKAKTSQTIPGGGDKPPPPPPPVEPRELPRDDEKKVGSFVAEDKKWLSVLVQRKTEANPWAILQPGDGVYTANTLISLPGYRSLIALDSGVNLMLWGTLPEFTAFPPLLESSIMLNAPEPGFDLDFTLDCGRVHVANRKEPKGPVKLRLRFLRETWDLELADENSEVVLELWAKPTEMAADGSRSKPYLCLGAFTSGKVKVQTRRQRYEDLAGCARLSWATVAPDRENRETLPAKPAWWTKAPDNKEERVQKALRSLLDWRDVLGANPDKAKKPEKDRESLAATIKQGPGEKRARPGQSGFGRDPARRPGRRGVAAHVPGGWPKPQRPQRHLVRAANVAQSRQPERGPADGDSEEALRFGASGEARRSPFALPLPRSPRQEGNLRRVGSLFGRRQPAGPRSGVLASG